MVKFIEVNPENVAHVRDSYRGRLSFQILNEFLEANIFVAQLDRTGMEKGLSSLYSSLSTYVRRHEVPIRVFSREKEIFLLRLDIDKDGNEIPDWQNHQEKT